MYVINGRKRKKKERGERKVKAREKLRF